MIDVSQWAKQGARRVAEEGKGPMGEPSNGLHGLREAKRGEESGKR